MSVSKRKTKKKIASTLLIHSVIIIVCLLCVVPMITVITVSVSSNSYLLHNGYSIFPREFSLTAYKYILRFPQGLIRAYGISIFVAVVGCAFSLLISSMFAYAISRRDFVFWKPFSMYLLLTMLFNGGMVSSYIVVTNYYHLKDNLLVLILPYAIGAMNVFILRTFFSSVPKEIIDSAKIDGANEFYAFFKIIVPISKPAIATIGVLILLSYWNDWWLGLLYIDNNRLAPLQLMLNNMMINIDFLRTHTMSASAFIKASDFPTESARMAMCILAAGPMLFVFPFFQQYFVKGLTVGSIKG